MSLSWQTGSKLSVHVNAVRKRAQTDRRTERQTDAEARGAQSVGHGGQRVSPQRFLPLGYVLNASLWHRRRWERPDWCADEVRAEGDRALPDLPSAPLRSSPPTGVAHGPRGRLRLFIVCRKKGQTPQPRDWTVARAPAGSVLWTLVSRHASRDGDETAFTTGESLAVHARNHDEAPIILVVLHYPEATSAAAHEGTNATPTLEIPQRFMDLE